MISCLATGLFILEQNGKINLQENTRYNLGKVYWKNLSSWLTREKLFVKVLDALCQEGVKIILLKGVALQGSLYKNLGQRMMADFDILVHPKDFLLAAKIIGTCGFNLENIDIPTALAQLEKIPRIHWPKDLSFDNKKRLVIELHQSLIDPWFSPAFPITMEGIWDRSGQIDQENNDPVFKNYSCVRSLSKPDTLAHLCLNLALHGLIGSQTCLDIDLLIRTLPEAWDWEQFLSLVEQWQIHSVAYHAMSICRDFMDTPVPPGILKRLDPGWFARLRVRILISSQIILSDRPSLGRRFPTLVKLALIDRLPVILVTIKRLLFPGKAWQENNLARRSIFRHWLNVFQAVKRGD